MAPPDILELTVEKLVPGGDGLARHQGKVVFVPGALPGEKVRARLVESKKDYARAAVLEVVSPSPERVPPPCPVAGRCGGCDWQHIDYAAQLRHKVAMAQDALQRLGGLSWPDLAIEAGEPWRYRNRVQLHRGPAGIGFLARSSHEVIPVSSCPVAHPALDALLSKGSGSAGGETPRLPPFRSGPGPGRRRPEPERRSAWAHDAPGGPLAVGGFASQPDDAAEIEVRVLGKPVRFDLRCFFQSNLPMLGKLIPYALEGAAPGGAAGKVAMDLYCGVGLFGAFLADRFQRVLAVEENAFSLAYARRNIPGDHAFLEGRIEDLLASGDLAEAAAGATPEAVIVDPPRPGLDQAVRDWLAAARPPRLVYVSCNPVTLARDLKSLLGAGYALESMKLFDFYPQTAHVEAVARLRIP